MIVQRTPARLQKSRFRFWAAQAGSDGGGIGRTPADAIISSRRRPLLRIR